MSTEIKKALLLLTAAVGIATFSIGATLYVEKESAAHITSAAEAPADNTQAASTTPTPPATQNTANSTVNSALTAQIVSVKPHYVTKVIPYQSCHDEAQSYYVQGPSGVPGAGALIGGTTGAVVGNMMGHGRSRIASSVAGAIIGAVGGNAIQESMSRPQLQTSYVTVCKTHYLTKHVQRGYEVTYNFNGQQGTKIMSTPPSGNTLPMQAVPVG